MIVLASFSSCPAGVAKPAATQVSVSERIVAIVFPMLYKREIRKKRQAADLSVIIVEGVLAC